MISHLTTRCHDFIWFLIFTFTLSSMPYLEMLFPYKIHFHFFSEAEGSEVTPPPTNTQMAQAQAETSETTSPAEPSAPAESPSSDSPSTPPSENTDGATQTMSSSSSESQNPATPSVSFKVDDFTGAAHLSYPIAVPPARAGLIPQVSINYSSSGGNGLLGVGWDLAAGGYIQRRGPRKGVPTYDDTKDVFELNLGGSPQELVYLEDGAGYREYRLRIEGAYLRIRYYPDPLNYWFVWDKSGLVMRFGYSVSSRLGKVRDPYTGANTYRWCLHQVEDPKTNYMDFIYQKDQDSNNTYQIYLQEIRYNGRVYPNLAHNHRIIFTLEPPETPRPDPVYNYRGGFKMLTQRRLASIEVKTNETRVRKYQFQYDSPKPNARSVLSAITLYGSGDPIPSPLPPTTFTYQPHTPGFDTGVSWPNPSPWNFMRQSSPWGTYADVLDINGDGVVERVGYDAQPPHDTWPVYQNDGYGFTAPELNWSNPSAWDSINGNYIRNWSTDNYGTSFDMVDMNGDGLPDHVAYDASPPDYDTWTVYFNNGNGFSSGTPWLNKSALDSINGNYIRSNYTNTVNVWGVLADVIDMNGDGRPDRVVYDENYVYSPGTPAFWKVYFNNGTGFDETPFSWKNPSPWTDLDGNLIRNTRLDGYGTYTDVIDMNGDGLPDRVVSDVFGMNKWLVYFNNGSGFDDAVDWLNADGYIRDVLPDEGLKLSGTHTDVIDMNGDGLPDRVVWQGYHTDWTVYLNNGSGFGPEISWDPGYSLSLWIRVNQWLYMADNFDVFDIDGDGLPDRIDSENDGNPWRVYKNKGPVADLLSEVNNGIGGSIQISYAPSSDYTNTHLPFIVQVVKEVTQSDGRDDSYTTRYEYEGGYYNPSTVEFRGFRKVTACQPNCLDGQYETKTETWFHQDYLRKGKVETQIVTSRPPDGYTEGHTRRVDNVWAGSDRVGILQGTTWYLDYNGDNLWDASKDWTLSFGISGIPVVGDWNGNGAAKIGVFQSGQFYLDYNGNGAYDGPTIDRVVNFGMSGDIPVAGDWNGDGVDTIGVYRGNIFYLRNSNTTGDSDMTFTYGLPGDTPVVGDWDGDGIDTIGVYRSGTYGEFYLRNSNSTGGGDIAITNWCMPGIPVVGDWNGDGRAKIGTYSGNNWWLDYNGTGVCGSPFIFKQGGGTPVVGNWGGSGFPALLETTSTITDMHQGVPYSYSHKTTYAYDQYLNLIEEHKYGDGMAPEETIRTHFSYCTLQVCLDNWILSKPTQITVKDHYNNVASAKWMDYNSYGELETEELCKSDTPSTGCITRNASQNVITTYEYDPIYKVLNRVIDPMLYVTEITYDSTKTFVHETTKICLDRPDCTKDHKTTTEYDPGTGNLIKLVPAHLQDTVYWLQTQYDPFGRKKLERVKDNSDPNMDPIVDRGSTSYTYFDSGIASTQYVLKTGKIVIEGVSGRTLRLNGYTYFDGMGRTYKAKTEDPDDPIANKIVVETQYDNFGRIEQQSNPYFLNIEIPLWTQFTYDGLSRLKDTLKPDGYQTHIDYKGLTKVVSKQVNATEWQSTAYTYDLMERVVTVQEAVGVQGQETFTHYFYDVLGNLNQVSAAKDASGNDIYSAPITTTMTYDSLKKKRTMTDPDTGSWAYTYDKVGNLLTQTDGTGRTINFEYNDGLNRLTMKTYVNSDPPESVVYTYDDPLVSFSMGKATKIRHLIGGQEVTVDSVAEFDVVQNVKIGKKKIGAEEVTFEKTYDSAGRVVSIKYLAGTPNEKTYSYKYDAAGNLLYVKDDGMQSNVVAYSEFTALGQRGRADYSNGVITTYDYYPETRRLKTLFTTKLGIEDYQDLEYWYDGKGNITTLADYKNDITHNYEYDHLSRLTLANGVGVNPYTESYQYDRIGNITYKSGVGYYHYDYGNKPHAVRSVASQSPLYTLPEIRITYNYEQKPTLFEKKNGGDWEEYVKFTYDGNGQRVKKENVDAAQTTLYFGELYEKRGTVEILHVFAGSTRVASIRSDSMNQFYHPNHLGSASVVTSSSGDWGERIEYYPFGSYRLDEKNPNLPGFPDANYTFTGQEDDDDLGLYNFGARLYDPVIARFISPDSLVQAPEDPQTLNRYSYARNNPLIYSDPSGNFFLVDDLAALIGSMLVAKLIVSAAAGAALGAGIAAATGGDIGKGALTGAISGVIFLGAGEIIPGIQTALGATKGVAEVAVKTGVHMAAGAVSGAINSAITGTDIGLGVVSGAIGAGIAAGVGGGLTALKLDKFGYQFVGRVVSGAIAGGIAAELYGGNFWEGFKLGGATAAAAFLFNEMMGPHGKKGNAGGCAGGDGEDLVEDFYEYEIRKMEEKIEMDRIAMELALIKAGEGIQTGMRLGLKAFFIWGVGRGAIEAYSGASSNVGPLIRFLWRISVVPTQVRSDTPQGEK